MEENKLIEYIQNVKSYGSEADGNRFDAVVRQLYNDPRIQKMPSSSQESLFDKLYAKYSKNLKIPEGGSALGDAEVAMEYKGNSEGDGGTVSQGDFLGSAEDTQRSLESGIGGVKEKLGSQLAGAAVSSIVAGVPLAETLEGALTNPGTLASVGIGAVGDMMTSGMGFGVDQGWVSKLGQSGLSAALGMFNPVLGLAASVLGKPIADFLGDATGMRDLDAMRDSIEDVMGEVGGRQEYASIFNDLQESFGIGLEGIREDERSLSISDLSDLKHSKIDKEYEDGLIDLKEYNMKKLNMKPIDTLAAKTKEMEITSSPYERMTDKAADANLKYQDQMRAGILGITTDELAERKTLAAGLGIDNLTGSAIAQAQEDLRKAEEVEQARVLAEAQAKQRAEATTYRDYKDSGGVGTQSDWSKYGTPNYTPGNERASSYGGNSNGGSSQNSNAGMSGSSGRDSASTGAGAGGYGSGSHGL